MVSARTREASSSTSSTRVMPGSPFWAPSGHLWSSNGPDGRLGQRDRHRQPSARGFVRLDPAAHRLREAERHGEAEAEAGAPAAVVKSLERRKDACGIGACHAGTMVDDVDANLARLD